MDPLHALLSLALILLIGVLIYGPWQNVCTAYARQIMFEKRDAIFDMACEGKLSFNSREYRTIRALLERSIRFAHESTLPGFFFFWAMLALRGEKIQKPELQVAIERIADRETREQVQKLVYDAIDALLLMTIAKSPIAVVALVIFFIPLIVLVVIARVFVRTVRAGAREIVQFEAERVGSVADAVPV
jgi:hypothetical protein